MRYHDTGTRAAADTLYAWLKAVLPDAETFLCQTGYFAREGLDLVETEVRGLLDDGGVFRLVVGANEGDLTSTDLRYVIDLLAGHAPRASLHLAGASDVLMHSKVYYVESRDGVRHAFVGSANLTLRGLIANFEAAIAIDSVEDPEAPFDAIRDSILAWLSETRRGSLLVSESSIEDLVADGVVDVPRRQTAPLGAEKQQRRRALLPSVGTIVRVKRQIAATDKGREGVSDGDQRIPTPSNFPEGVAGIVKRLSTQDTKAFRGDRGTPYVALPRDVAAFLPLAPYGRNGDPRMDVAVDAYVDSLPGRVFKHTASSSPNITYVGMGRLVTSHRDLRFNYLMPIARSIIQACDDAQMRRPKVGDVAAVVFVEQHELRLLFVFQEPLRTQLEDLITNTRGGWGWLSSEIAAKLPIR